MPNGVNILGRGGLALSIADAAAAQPRPPILVRYEIQSTGLVIYSPPDRRDGVSLAALIKTVTTSPTATVAGTGHISLDSLPATPQKAFTTVTLRDGPDAFALQVTQSSAFAQQANLSLADLSLQFTERKSDRKVEVTGGVTATVFNQPYRLNAALDAAGLSFRYNPAAGTNAPIAIAQLGSLTLSTFEISVSPTRWQGIQELYTFDEGSGTKIVDISGSVSGNTTPLDLTVANGSAVSWLPGRLAVTSATRMTSATAATPLINACRASNELTIEAWVQPATANQNTSARIVTLAPNVEDRNFSLQQGEFQNKILEPTLYAARIRSTERPKGDNPLRTAVGATTPTLTQVVYSRDAKGVTKFYINGQERVKDNLGGDFSNWDANYSLTLANEFPTNQPDSERAWLGEYHRVALFNRALTATEVLQSYYPAIRCQGTLSLAGSAKPLDNLVVAIAFFPDRTQVLFQPTAPVEIVPDLRLESVDLRWTIAATVSLVGTATANLWGNAIPVNASWVATGVPASAATGGPTSSPTGTSASGQNLLTFGRIQTDNITLALAGLGSLALLQLQLRPNLAITPATWDIITNARATLTAIPSPLRGPFAAAVGIEQSQLKLRITEAGPLLVGPNLRLTPDQLRFTRVGSGWTSQGGVQTTVFGRAFGLAAQFNGPTFFLEGPTTPLPPAATGALNLTNLRLTAQTGDPPWQFVATGRVERDPDPDLFDFSASGQVFLGDPTVPTTSQTTLRTGGTSALRILADAVFNGDVQVASDRFTLTGRFTGFPQPGSSLQVNGDARITVGPDGQVSLPASPVSFALADFPLVNPLVAIANGRLTLNGQWLGQAIAFDGSKRANQFIWQGPITFGLPFDLTLGPLYEPQTRIKLADQIRVVCQDPGQGQVMQAALGVELSAAGFLATVNGSFPWQDDTRGFQNLSVPELKLFTPPTTRNALLGALIGQVKQSANDIFAPRFKHPVDYFIATAAGNIPLLYFGNESGLPSQTIDSDLPAVLTLPNQRVADANNRIELTSQSQTANRLSLNLANLSPTDIATAYTDFFNNLARLETQGNLQPGAVNLIKQRIAERLIMGIDQVLFYHYGFNLGRGFVDLQAGMQLRVDFQNFQNVPANDATATNGFVGSGASTYQLTSYLQPQADGTQRYLLGFDPFVSRLPDSVQTDASRQGASGLVDLLKPGFRQPYYRLFYPSQFSPPGGRVGAERTITLVGASRLEELQFATTQFLRNNAIDASPTGSRVSFFFRGRVTVVPEITVFVQEQPVEVPVGTTLRQLRERYAHMPAAGFGGQDLRSLQGTPRARRLVHEGVNSTPTYCFLNLNAYAAVNGSDIFDLPVVKGDRFYF